MEDDDFLEQLKAEAEAFGDDLVKRAYAEIVRLRAQVSDLEMKYELLADEIRYAE